MREHTYPGSYESHLRMRVKELQEENEMWRRVWEAMEEKLEQAPLGEEPLEFWGGYRAALLDMRDLATRERASTVGPGGQEHGQPRHS